MGAIHFSIDSKLVDTLAMHFQFEVFVETGTYKGETVEMVKPYFNRLYSIELSDYYVELARSKFKDDPMVTILHGDAGTELKNLVQDLAGKSVLFWLDSHWCEDLSTAGKTSQCSLLKELKSIDVLNNDSMILIDDARLFLCPPSAPHDYSQWPDFQDILNALKEKSACHELMVINDIIVFFPEKIKSVLRRYAHKNGIDWLSIVDIYRQSRDLISDMEAKEKEIKALSWENKIIVQKTEIKEREITIKEQEIKNVSSVAEQRLYIINQFESAIKDIRFGFEEALENLRAQISEKQSHIETLNTLISEKDKRIGDLDAIAESRLHVIREQENAIHSYQQKRSIKERIKLWLQPRLGVLYHYPPRPFDIPKKYYKEINKQHHTKDLPVISIVTPSFNQANFIERTIKSVLQQEYPKVEYLVQDGGSQDGTVDILQKYDDQLGKWESKKDKGQADALNRCFQNTTGNIMAYLNSDDLLLPGALHYVARYFIKHPEVDVVYGHRVLIDEYDQEIGRWVLPPHEDEVLSWADYIPQETMFWRRKIWEKAGGYVDKDYRFAMDWELILRFRDAGSKFVRLPRFLGAFRIHPHQKTSAEISEQGDKEMGRLRERCLGRMVSEPEINQNIKKYLSRHVLYQKLYRAGLLKY